MAGTWTAKRFPQFEAAIRQLTEQHRELVDEPLHLAVAYDPRRERPDIFLLEVIGGMSEAASTERELFETVFQAGTGLPLPADERLHLVLTTPGEWERAQRDGWHSAREIIDAIERDDYRVLFADEVGDRLLRKIKPSKRRQQGIARG